MQFYDQTGSGIAALTLGAKRVSVTGAAWRLRAKPENRHVKIERFPPPNDADDWLNFRRDLIGGVHSDHQVRLAEQSPDLNFFSKLIREIGTAGYRGAPNPTAFRLTTAASEISSGATFCGRNKRFGAFLNTRR